MKKYHQNEFDRDNYALYADECPVWSAPFGLKLLEHIVYKTDINALDIGFGTGFPLTEIALRLGGNSTIYGIDPWKAATERAKKKIDFYGIRNIRLISGRAESIPLPDKSIDLIVSNNGINNVSDIGKVLAECSRLIKPGGQFIITMNTEQTMFEFYEQFERALSEMNMEHEKALMHNHIYEKRKPVAEMTRMLSENAFLIKDLIHDQFNYRFSDGSAMLNHYFIRLAFMDSWMKILPEEKREIIFSKVEDRLNEHANLIGGIKLSIPFILINSISLQ
jgi:ubiquinone/menaquinone biosynthesis C-methylase UbiE